MNEHLTQQLYLFPDVMCGEAAAAAKKKNKARWLAQKGKDFGLERCATAMFCGKYGMPLLAKYTGDVPQEFVTFTEMRPAGSRSKGVACHDYDFELERLWARPDDFVSTFKNYVCCTPPDFSLKVGAPLGVQIANAFRSHCIGYYMQENGVAVLPTMMWSTPQSYEFCFDGYSRGGVVMVATMGTQRDERSRGYFKSGFFEMLRKVSPDMVVLYGDVSDDMRLWLPQQLEVRHVEHGRFKRMRGDGR